MPGSGDTAQNKTGMVPALKNFSLELKVTLRSVPSIRNQTCRMLQHCRANGCDTGLLKGCRWSEKASWKEQLKPLAGEQAGVDPVRWA